MFQFARYHLSSQSTRAASSVRSRAVLRLWWSSFPSSCRVTVVVRICDGEYG